MMFGIGGGLTNVKIIGLDGGGVVIAQINPKELAYSKSVGWAEQNGKGRDFPDLQFTAGKAITISLELLFDYYESNGDVRFMTNALLNFAMRDESLHRPPKVMVEWGGPVFSGGFEGVVESVKVRYTMFLPSGVPCRAVATVGFKQAGAVSASGNSPDIAKQRIVKRGETLQSIAETEYRDASEWRRIADANNIDDPLSVEPGARLLLPPIL